MRSTFTRLHPLGFMLALGLLGAGCVATQSQRGAETTGAESAMPALFKQAEGFYVNRDGFYGALERVEYLHVRLEEGSLVAHKLVGDANVPRGQVSWKTTPGLSAEALNVKAGEGIPAWVQIRVDPSDPQGYAWLSDGCSVTIHEDGTLSLIASLQGMELSGRFEPVRMEDAVEAANTMKDHP